jgi:hypothetical protein
MSSTQFKNYLDIKAHYFDSDKINVEYKFDISEDDLIVYFSNGFSKFTIYIRQDSIYSWNSYLHTVTYFKDLVSLYDYVDKWFLNKEFN